MERLKTTVLGTLLLLMVSIVVYAEEPQKMGMKLGQGNKSGTEFKFSPDGSFKIVQITDTHFSRNNSDERTNYVIDRISDVISTEKPDFIIMTGDIVTSASTAKMWDKIRAMLDVQGISYAVTYGNHDREEEFPDYELPQCFVNDPLCINTVTDEGFLEDLAIPIASSTTTNAAAVLYLIDSGDYSPVSTFWDYGWITHDRIHWYVEKSREFARHNNNVPIPSFAFFHIPTDEFNLAYNENLICGVRGEDECPPELNSGIFSAFEENGDVHGVFVGHDHENDYVARIGGIAAVYGRCCFHKGDGVVPGNGTRVIELKEGDYGFRTWIREPEAVVDDIHFDVPVNYTLHRAAEVSDLQPGLVRTMYSEVKEMTEMETTAIKGETAIVPTPRMYDVMGKGVYGAVQEGFVYVPESGAWSFHISANDEGYVCLDDVNFVPTDYGRGQIKINVEKGYHHLKIYIKDNGGSCWCKLMWRDQYNATYHEIPAEYYFHK